MKPLSFICIALVFSTIYSLINCSVYGESCRNYSPLSFRFFSQPFVRFLEKNKNVIHQPRSVRIRKNCALCLVYPRPRAQFFPIRTDLGWWITHIYIYIYIYIFLDRTQLFWPNAQCHLQGLNKLFLHLMRALLLHNNDRLSLIFSCMLLIRNHKIFLVQFEINCVNWFPFHLYLKRCLLLNYIIDEPAALISPFPKIFLRTDINECPPFLPAQTQSLATDCTASYSCTHSVYAILVAERIEAEGIRI